jgi:Putative Ig domain/Fibronectin type III domain
MSGLLLAACGNGVGVSPATDTATVAPASTTPASTPAPTSPSPAPPAASVKLAGTPATSITAGQDYLFQPKVAQGGGVVTFKIQGQPTWATFDPNTGVLTGTPATANEGTTGSITITGTNGSSSASIGPFTIVVKAPASTPGAGAGTTTLTWTPPTQNTDGTPIIGLTGYHIHYGTSVNALSTTITVTDVSQTSYVVSGLAPGTYYFAVDAFNAAGVDSAESNVGAATI